MKINPSFWLSLFFIILFSGAIVTATNWSWDTGLFPYAVAIPALILALCQLVLDVKNTQKNGVGSESPAPQIMDITVDQSLPKEVVWRGTAVAFGWILCFVVSIWLVGFLIAVPLFVFFYLWYQARALSPYSP